MDAHRIGVDAVAGSDDSPPSSRPPVVALATIIAVWAVYVIATDVAQGKYVGVTALWCMVAIVLVHAVVAAVMLAWLQRRGAPALVQVGLFFCVLVPLPLPAVAVLGVLAARSRRAGLRVARPRR